MKFIPKARVGITSHLHLSHNLAILLLFMNIQLRKQEPDDKSLEIFKLLFIFHKILIK